MTHRFVETRDPELGSCVHLVGPGQGGEFTLCGVAFDAGFSEDDPALIWHETRRSRVNCSQCVAVIQACRGLATAAETTDLRLPDEQPWAWDDPDLPVDLFLAAFRRTHPTSRYTDLKLRDRWRTGTRIDSDGHFHDYPGNVKSWAEAMDGAEVTHEAKRECVMVDRAGVKGARRRVDDILELLVELDEAAVEDPSPVRAVHERLVIEATALALALKRLEGP